MKEGWTYRTLEEVCNINYGTRVVQKKDKGTTYYVYGGGGATFMIDRYNREDCFIVSRFAMSPQCTRYVKGKFFLNDSGLSVSTNNKLLLQPFLDKTLFAYNDIIYSLGKGMAQRNLDMPSFKKIIIPIPPLSEQQRIVSELDLLSSIIEKKKAQLKEYDQLAQSIFYDMFGDPIENPKGWEVKKLGEVAKEKLSYGSGASAVPYDNEIRYVRITDIKDDGELNCDIVSPNTYDDKYLLSDGDILFARSGATVGKTFLYKEKYGKCIYAGYLIRLIPNAKIVIPSYVYGFTKSPYYRSFVAKAQNAVAQPNINAKQYSELSIPLPPLPLQQSFASKIEGIERQKALIQQSITETETLFDSRMDFWFS